MIDEESSLLPEWDEEIESLYPQLKEPVTQYIASQFPIRHSVCAELETAKEWIIPADRLFNKLTSNPQLSSRSFLGTKLMFTTGG